MPAGAWIARLHRLEGKAPGEPRGRPRVRRPTEDDRRTAEDVLRCLPGISDVSAAKLLSHFGSLAGVFAADEAALREVAGIGPVRGAALARLFRGSQGRTPPRAGPRGAAVKRGIADVTAVGET